jgi:hypothetical protein
LSCLFIDNSLVGLGDLWGFSFARKVLDHLDAIAPEVAVVVKMTGYRSSESGMIDFQSALKAAQNPIVRKTIILFIRG